LQLFFKDFTDLTTLKIDNVDNIKNMFDCHRLMKQFALFRKLGCLFYQAKLPESEFYEGAQDQDQIVKSYPNLRDLSLAPFIPQDEKELSLIMKKCTKLENLYIQF
jgi:hypothetical protein